MYPRGTLEPDTPDSGLSGYSPFAPSASGQRGSRAGGSGSEASIGHRPQHACNLFVGKSAWYDDAPVALLLELADGSGRLVPPGGLLTPADRDGAHRRRR